MQHLLFKNQAIKSCVKGKIGLIVQCHRQKEQGVNRDLCLKVRHGTDLESHTCYDTEYLSLMILADTL